MRDYILPIPELKKIEPILTEYFGYKRAMFENELLATYMNIPTESVKIFVRTT